MSLKTPRWGTLDLELWYPNTNEEHVSFLVLKIFLKIFPTNFFFPTDNEEHVHFVVYDTFLKHFPDEFLLKVSRLLLCIRPLYAKRL